MTSSIWGSVEIDAISRDFDYEEYLKFHDKCKCQGQPIQKSSYNMLVQFFHNEYKLDNEQTLNYP